MLVEIMTAWRRLSSRTSTAVHPRLFRPHLEGLEDRWTPAENKYFWNPALDIVGDVRNYNWSDPRNWDIWDSVDSDYEFQSTATPGAGDWAVFDGSEDEGDGNLDCIVDVNGGVVVAIIEVKGGYGKNIVVSNPLTIAPGTATSKGLLALNVSASSAALRGSPPGETAVRGTVNINANSEFIWYAGNLVDLTINVARTETATAMITVPANEGKNRSMDGTDFNVSGELNWRDGNVDVVNPWANSRINIGSTGRFNIGLEGWTWSSGTWGVSVGAQTSHFQIQNDGRVTLNASGQATLKGNYTTTSLTRLDKGILDLAGKAEQTAGTFELRDSTTVKVSGTSPGYEQVLRIRNGIIRGHGTVDGNLTLGYDPAYGPPPQTVAVIDPGWTDTEMFPVFKETHTPGTLTITQSFEMFASGSRMGIGVAADGGYDKVVVVNGYAAVSGGALSVHPSPDYHPPAGTTVTFLTAGAGIQGDFSNRTITYQGAWMDPAIGKSVWWFFESTSSTYSIVATPSPV